jgi:hypothetical protein
MCVVMLTTLTVALEVHLNVQSQLLVLEEGLHQVEAQQAAMTVQPRHVEIHTLIAGINPTLLEHGVE